MMISRVLILLTFIIISTVSARHAFAAENGAATPSSPLPVLVSIAPQKFLLERIAGKAVEVTVLVRPGSDPHVYEPSPSQVRAASASAIWFTIGVPFEDVWQPRITANAPKLAVVSLISGITRLQGEGADHEAEQAGHEEKTHGHHDHEAEHGHGQAHAHGGEDPHVWLSPMLVRKMLPQMTRALANALPERAAEFRANAKALDAELEALDATLALRFQPFPPEQRVFLTFHPSWRYFAHNYQLTELSIEVEGKEPSPRKLQEIMNVAKAHGITTVFAEPQFPKGAARAIADTLGARVVEADPLAEDLLALYASMAEKLVQSFRR